MAFNYNYDTNRDSHVDNLFYVGRANLKFYSLKIDFFIFFLYGHRG